jgi:hypothetical protein
MVFTTININYPQIGWDQLASGPGSGDDFVGNSDCGYGV